jgi:hypothetical protein
MADKVLPEYPMTVGALTRYSAARLRLHSRQRFPDGCPRNAAFWYADVAEVRS